MRCKICQGIIKNLDEEGIIKDGDYYHWLCYIKNLSREGIII